MPLSAAPSLSRRAPPFVRSFFSSPRVWLAALLALTWALRLFHLGAMSIWWDESLSYDRATHDLATILANTIRIQNIVTHDLHPPLYFVLLHYAVLAFGVTEFALRVLSTFANVLTVALVYPVVRLLARLGGIRHGARVGVLAALFAALSPFYVWYSQEARPYALVLLWSLLAVYLLLKACSHTAAPRHRLLLLATYLLALAATLATHYLSFVLLPFYAATLLIFGLSGNRQRTGIWRGTAALALLLLAAFGAALVLLPGSAAQLTGSDYGSTRWVPLFVILRDLLNSFAVGVTANLDTVAWFDLALLALWIIGVASTLRPAPREARVAGFLLGFLLLPPLALEAGSYLRPLYMNSRHLITASPAFYIGLALGADALARRAAAPLFAARGRIPSRWRYAATAAAACALVVAGAAYSLNNLYFNPAYAKDDHRGWAEYLSERIRPDDLLVLDAPQAETIYRYYAPPGLKWISLPHLGYAPDQQSQLDFASVRDAFQNAGRVWYLQLHRPVADPLGHISDLLRRFGQPVDTTLFAGTSTQIILQEYIPGSAVVPETTPLPHSLSQYFGDNLQLVGFDVPATLAAGTRGAVKLYWRLDRWSGEAYGVSLRAVDANGTEWGRSDTVPLGNKFTTMDWTPGTTVLETHDLPLDPAAPPGTYWIEVSAYHSQNHAPLPLTGGGALDPGGVLRLGALTITRPAAPLDPRALAFDHPADATLGRTLEFLGYNADDAPVLPGGAIPLQLYFRSLENPGRDVNGRVMLTFSPLPFWSQPRATAPFSLALRDRLPGDIVRADVAVRVPGDSNAGGYSLSLALDDPPAQIALGGAQVQALARSTVQPDIAHPLSAQLGDALEFLGYNLDGPDSPRAGDTLALTLFWRARRPLDTSYTVFTHLLDANNQIVGQNDSVPVNGTRPTTSWSPDEIIADRHEFEIQADAAPGRYVVEIGAYNAADGARLPVFISGARADGDRIVLETLTLQ